MKNKRKNPEKNLTENRKRELIPLGSDRFYILLIVILASLLFGTFLFSDTMIYGSDTMQGYYGKVFTRAAFREMGTYPRWNPLILGGMPTVDATFGDLLYPAAILQVIMTPYRALGYKFLLHTILCGILTFFMLRRCYGIRRNTALLGAVLFMFNCETVSLIYGGHDGKYFVTSMMPGMIWAMERMFKTLKIIYAVPFALILGLMIYTAHIQLTYFVLWGIFLIMVFRLFTTWKKENDKKKTGIRFLFFWAAVFLGLGFSMTQLYAPYKFANNYSVRGSEEHTSYEHATSWSLHPEEVASLAVPEFTGLTKTHESGNTYWGRNYFKLNTEYAGITVLVLSILFLFVARTRETVFWSAIAALALIYALGGNTPFFRIFYHLVPGVKLFRGPSMIMFWFSFGLMMASVTGASEFFKKTDNGADKDKLVKSIYKGMAAVGAIMLIITLMNDTGLLSIWKGIFYTGITSEKEAVFRQNYSNFRIGLWINGILALLILYFITSYLKGGLKKNTLILAILVISLADLFRINTKFVVAEDPDDYIQKDNAIRSIETDEDPFRAYALPGTYRINNYLPVFGIETPGGFHDNELSWYRDYRGGRSSENFHYKLAKNEVNTNPFLNLLNVKYLVFRPDGRGKPAAILNEGAMPRVFTADSYIYDTRKNILGMLRNEKINYRNTVMLEENFPELQKMNFKKTEDTDSLSKSKAKLKEYTPNHRTIEAEMVSDGFLVISDNYYPGWHAKVDGREKEIYRAYGTIKALPLEKGKHEVEIYFSSAYVRTGKKFTLISLILMAGISVFHFIRRFRSGGHSA